MERLPELKKMRAGSLAPELYDEILEFFSSVHPDFAISGKTSLYAIYSLLQSSKKKKMSSKQLKRAEEMVRALCAAAETPREMRAKELAGGTEKEAPKKKMFGRNQPEQLAISPEAEKKFNNLGITSRNAMERVMWMLGEEEFSKRHDFVISNLDVKAFRPFFASVPDFITSPEFYHAIALIAVKAKILDELPKEGGRLDYTRNPSILLCTLREIAAEAGLHTKIENMLAGGKFARVNPAEMAGMAETQGLHDPKRLAKFLKKIGFSVTPLTPRSFACTKLGKEGGIESIIMMDFGRTARCHDVALSELFGQAWMAEKLRKEAGVEAR
jgi:hypothetical protein